MNYCKNLCTLAFVKYVLSDCGDRKQFLTYIKSDGDDRAEEVQPNNIHSIWLLEKSNNIYLAANPDPIWFTGDLKSSY